VPPFDRAMPEGQRASRVGPTSGQKIAIGPLSLTTLISLHRYS
jgi:hypothetical protein